MGFYKKAEIADKICYFHNFRLTLRAFSGRLSLIAILDVAQLVAHLVRDQEVAGSSPVIQTKKAGRFDPLFVCIYFRLQYA